MIVVVDRAAPVCPASPATLRVPLRHRARAGQRRRARQERRGRPRSDARRLHASPRTTSRRRSPASTSKSWIAVAGATDRAASATQAQSILSSPRPRRRLTTEREGSQPSVRSGESRHARPAAHRAVLRPELDAARRGRARGGRGARLRGARSCRRRRSHRHRLVLDSRCRSSRTSPPTREQLRERHRRDSAANNAAGFEDGWTGDAEDTPDNGNAFTADDTEFNIFNTDRRLDALRTLADQLAGIEQKKSVIYFSSGMSQQGQRQPGAAAAHRRSRQPRQRVDLRGRHARPAGAGPGRRRDPGQPARHVHVLRRLDAKPVQQSGGFAGHADDDRGGYRRTRVLRLEHVRSACSTASSTTRRRTTCSATRAPTLRATAASAASRCG